MLRHPKKIRKRERKSVARVVITLPLYDRIERVVSTDGRAETSIF
jgi:hypothetical protein